MTKKSKGAAKENPLIKKNSLADIAFPNNFTLAGILPTNTGYTIDAINVIQASAQPYIFSNNYWVLNYLYKNEGIVQTFIDQPVEDAFRGGIIIDTSDTSFGPKEMQQIYDWLDHSNALSVYCLAEKWARLFGGGGVIISDGRDLSSPFNIDEVRKDQELEFIDANLWDLGEDTTNKYAPASETINLSAFDVNLKPFVPNPKNGRGYFFHGEKLDPSRVIRIMGKEGPTQLRTFLRGWGMSVVERLIRPLSNYYKLNELTANYIDQAKIDVFKFEGLNDAFMTENGAAAVQAKAQIAALMKGLNNGLALDKEDDYIQKQISFSGVPEFKEQIRIELASAIQFPVSKLWGTGSKAFSSGEDDIENYNAMVESTVRGPSRIKLIPLVKLAFKVNFGRIPDKFRITFHPLRMLGAAEEASMKATLLDSILRSYDRGLINKDGAVRLLNAEAVYRNEINPQDTTEDPAMPPPDRPKLDLYGDDSKERNKLFKV
jgi:uncharacterized protein